MGKAIVASNRGTIEAACELIGSLADNIATSSVALRTLLTEWKPASKADREKLRATFVLRSLKSDLKLATLVQAQAVIDKPSRGDKARTEPERRALGAARTWFRYYAKEAGWPSDNPNAGRKAGDGRGKSTSAAPVSVNTGKWPVLKRPAGYPDALTFFLALRDVVDGYLKDVPEGVKLGGLYEAGHAFSKAITLEAKVAAAEAASKPAPAKATI